MIFDRIRRMLQGQEDSGRPEMVADCVWISTSAKLNGIRAELEQASARGASVVALVAHFPDVLRALEDIAANYGGPCSVRAVLARQLSADAGARLPLGESAAMELIVAERHPLASEDENLTRFAESLPCRSRIVCHVSLDDPLLQWFGGESVRSLLGRFGAKADEPITHPLITQSLKRAQTRIAADAFGQSDADSAAAWLEQNVRR